MLRCAQTMYHAARPFSTGAATSRPAGTQLSPPTIDAGALLREGPDSQAAQKAVDEIAQASAEWGFFQVVNHGFDEEIQKRFYGSVVEFFDMPLEKKKSVERTENNSRGYFNNELTKQTVDMKEGFDFGQDGMSEIDGYNQWIDERVAGPFAHRFRRDMSKYYDACHDLSVVLVESMAIGLDLEKNYFHKYFDSHSSFLRLNYYPPLEDTTGVLGVNRHKDAGFLTVLKQLDESGLQVYTGSGDGAGFDPADPDWVVIPPDDNAFVINVGDMWQVFSNDKYKAPLHRVLPSSGKPRYSAPFFYNPNYTTDCIPVPGTGAPMYKPVNWGHFRSQRFLGDYADHGEELQISHFRL